MSSPQYTTTVDKAKVDTSDIFNLARGLDLYVVASICERHGLTMPTLGASVDCGFCDDAGAPVSRGDATRFGWTLAGAAGS